MYAPVIGIIIFGIFVLIWAKHYEAQVTLNEYMDGTVQRLRDSRSPLEFFTGGWGMSYPVDSKGWSELLRSEGGLELCASKCKDNPDCKGFGWVRGGKDITPDRNTIQGPPNLWEEKEPDNGVCQLFTWTRGFEDPTFKRPVTLSLTIRDRQQFVPDDNYLTENWNNVFAAYRIPDDIRNDGPEGTGTPDQAYVDEGNNGEPKNGLLWDQDFFVDDIDMCRSMCSARKDTVAFSFRPLYDRGGGGECRLWNQDALTCDRGPPFEDVFVYRKAGIEGRYDLRPTRLCDDLKDTGVHCDPLQPVILKCPPGRKIQIQSVYWGSEADVCGEGSSRECGPSAEAEDIVKGLCDGKESCSVRPSVEMLGDGLCPGFKKYLRIKWACVVPEP